MTVQTFTPEETRQIVQTIALVNARLDAVEGRLRQYEIRAAGEGQR